MSGLNRPQNVIVKSLMLILVLVYYISDTEYPSVLNDHIRVLTVSQELMFTLSSQHLQCSTTNYIDLVKVRPVRRNEKQAPLQRLKCTSPSKAIPCGHMGNVCDDGLLSS